jgi:hypothetical protein
MKRIDIIAPYLLTLRRRLDDMHIENVWFEIRMEMIERYFTAFQNINQPNQCLPGDILSLESIDDRTHGFPK